MAAVVFLPGTLLTLELMDQGQIVYPSWRVVHGALLYRDVGHMYGPSLVYLNAALLRLGGDDLLAVRLGVLAVRAALAMLVFHLASRVARRGIALATSALFIAVWSAPLWVYATPYAAHYALLAGLAGLAVLLARPLGTTWTALTAGVCFGVAASFKHTAGLFAETSVLVAACGAGLAGSTVGAPRLAAWVSHLIRAGAALLVLAYLWKTFATPTGLLLAAIPFMGMGADALRRRIVDGHDGLRMLLACAGGFVLPLLVWGLVLAWLGAGRALLDWLVVLPQRLSWFVPLPSVSGGALVLAGVMAGGWALVGNTRQRIGDAVVWVLALAVFGISAALTHGFRGSLLGVYLPVAIVVVAAPLGLAQGAEPAARLLWWFGAFMLLSLYPAADILHALMMLPAVLPLLAMVLEHAWRAAATPAARALVLAFAAGTILPPAVAGLTLLVGAVETPPRDAVGFARATGIRDGGPDVERMRRGLAAVDRVAAPGTPLLVLPNAQLAYFLADRPSVLEADEMVLYLVALGLLSPADARARLSEASVLSAVEQGRPVVLLWKRGQELDRILGVYPGLRDLIETRYRVTDEDAGARVLVPRDG